MKEMYNKLRSSGIQAILRRPYIIPNLRRLHLAHRFHRHHQRAGRPSLGEAAGREASI